MFKKIIFVSDHFADTYVGGAELSLQALIDTCPAQYEKVLAKNVSNELIAHHKTAFWVFGNFSQMKWGLIPNIVENIKYSVLEFDYKYCAYRSPDLHYLKEGMECNCRNHFLDAFFTNAVNVFWMSERQKKWYQSKVRGLSERNTMVLSSTFADSTLSDLEALSKNMDRNGWVIVHSSSEIKGFAQTLKYAEDHKMDFRVLRNMKYADLLAEMSKAEGLIYMPIGGDTCPRVVIEAKLLGCKLEVNDFVEHKNEFWFSGDVNLTRLHMETNKKMFWQEILSSDKEKIEV